MACSVCARLLMQSELLARAHVAAYDAMIAASGKPTPEFVKLRTIAYEAHIDAESARLQLERHQRTHAKAN
jgi:hypothetical protein